MSDSYCIYVLIDPLDSTNYRYCGYTKNSNRRLQQHILESKRGLRTTYKTNWINYLLSNGRQPELLIIRDNISTKEFASQLEIYYCDKFKKEGHKLTNTAEPGLGGDTYKNNPNRTQILEKIRYAIVQKNKDVEYKKNLSVGNAKVWSNPEHRRKMSLIKTGKLNGMYGVHRYGEAAPMYGKRHTLQTKQKISNSNRGKTRTEETRKKMSLASKGRPKSFESVSKHFKSVLQYDCDMNFIKKYPSIKQAALENGVQSTGISACCAGRLKTCGKYIWRYGNYENSTN